MYGTTSQIANTAGVAAIGAVFFTVESALSRGGAGCSVDAARVFDHRLCRIPVMDAARDRDKLTSTAKISFRGMTARGLFILQCSNYLLLVTL